MTDYSFMSPEEVEFKNNMRGSIPESVFFEEFIEKIEVGNWAEAIEATCTVTGHVTNSLVIHEDSSSLSTVKNNVRWYGCSHVALFNKTHPTVVVPVKTKSILSRVLKNCQLVVLLNCSKDSYTQVLEILRDYYGAGLLVEIQITSIGKGCNDVEQ